MISKRNLLIGGACALTAVGGEALKPHRHVSLLGKKSLAEVIPMSMKSWAGRDVTDLVAPKEEGSLASRLYSQTVGRIYEDKSSGLQIMMLVAYGNSQTDELQLHRPEKCYRSFGFDLTGNQALPIKLASDVTLPGRRILARKLDYSETIIYWSRLGEYLPDTGSKQRFDQMLTAMQGYVSDGVLARFSVSGNPDPSFTAGMLNFIPMLIQAIAPADRASLIGTANAAKFTSSVARSLSSTPGRG